MSDAVQQIYDNWGNRASLLEPEVVREGERVFKVGYQYSLTVPDSPDEPAKVAHLYRRWGASENPMPNMEVQDGELRIPVEDLADLILRRIPAAELAEGLWRDDSVRERFVECMANRYAGPVEDQDRRELLRQIQTEIHAVAVDEAIRRLNQLESNARCYTDHYRWRKAELGHYSSLHERYKNALYELREHGIIDDEKLNARLKLTFSPEQLKEYVEEQTDPVVKESVGEHWNESRNFWRDRLMEVLPPPCDSDGTATAAINEDLSENTVSEWRDVPEYEGYYEVSNLGKVRSLSRVVPSTARGGRRTIHPRPLKPRLDRDGYPVVTLTKHSQYKLVPVHRLVALAFHGPCPDGHECAHLDGNRANPCADNLGWATKAENEAHKYLHGTRQARAESIAQGEVHD